MHLKKYSILTTYSGLSFPFLLWRTTYMYRNTRYWQYIRAYLSLSLSLPLVMTYSMHVQKHSILTIYSSLSPSPSLWRTRCMYRNNRYWQYMRVTLSLVMTYNMHVKKHTKVKIYSDLSLSLSISLVMTHIMLVQKHSILTNYSGLSLSLSRYDVQYACSETLDTDNTFGPFSLSLSLSLWRTECMYRNTLYWQYIRASLPLSRYDAQDACTETIDTDNICGSLSLSSWRTTCMYRNTHNWKYIRTSLSLFLSLSLWRTKCMYRNTRYWQIIRASFSISHSLWCTTWMYRNIRYWQYIRASLSLSLVMTYNMHVQKHSILTT